VLFSKNFVDFSHAHFENGAEFGGVIFEDFANFSDATFKGKTLFDYSRFKRGATFRVLDKTFLTNNYKTNTWDENPKKR